MFIEIARAATVSENGETSSGLANKIGGFFDYLINQIPSWIAGFLVFVLTLFLAKMAKAAVEARIGDQVDEEHQEVLVLAGRVTYFGTLVIGVTVALKIAGIDLTTILAAVAFGIGFALQDLIMNFLAGVMILVSRQFTIGDFIKVGETVGKVVEIQTRATILKSIDGTKVIVPNSEIFTSQVISFTTNPTRRVVVPLYVAYGTNVSYAMKIALDVLKKHPRIMKKPAPSVVLKDYGDSSIDLTGRFWVGSRDGWFKIKSEIMQQMLEAFDAGGIVVPYNVMHVETGADTAEEWKNAQDKARKQSAEMQLSKAISADKPNIGAGGSEAKQIVGQNGEKIPLAVGATPSENSSGVQKLATVTVPTEPEAAYQDQAEIDGQA